LTIDAHLWTGVRGGTIEGGRIVVQDEKLVAIGLASEVELQGEHLDFSGKWIIPGLIDTHAHLVFGEAGRSYEDYIREDSDDMMLLRGVRNALLHQAVGVTTIRDAGGVNKVTISLREGINRGYIRGPRLLVSGRPVTITGGHFWWCGQEADGVDGVRRAVRELAKDGVDYIKIMASGGGTVGTDPLKASFTLEELIAIVEEAHQHGFKCSAHSEATAAVERAVRAGVDAIEHAGFQEPDGTRTYKPEVVKEMVEKELVYSPTIPTAFAGLRRVAEQGTRGDGEDARIRAAHYKLSRKLENLSRMLEAGVSVIAGTDAISQFGDYVTGLELFVYAGMTPEEALITGTSGAAKAIGMDHIGSIELGKAADLVVLNKNPLASISHVRNIAAVIQGGRLVETPKYVSEALPDVALPGYVSDVEGALAIVR